MAFESLSEKLQGVFKNLRSRTRCSEWFESGTDGDQDRKRRDGSINGINDDRDSASSR